MLPVWEGIEEARSAAFPLARDRNDAPRPHLNHCVGKGGSIFTIMRHVQHGDLQIPPHLMELGAPCGPEFRIETGERLIQQEDLGLSDEGPGQRHPLLLASGELVRVATAKLADSHHVQRPLPT